MHLGRCECADRTRARTKSGRKKHTETSLKRWSLIFGVNQLLKSSAPCAMTCKSSVLSAAVSCSICLLPGVLSEFSRMLILTHRRARHIWPASDVNVLAGDLCCCTLVCFTISSTDLGRSKQCGVKGNQKGRKLAQCIFVFKMQGRCALSGSFPGAQPVDT